MQRVLTTVTLLGLLVATAAAFAITEHLKLIKSPLSVTFVSKTLAPVCNCPQRKASVAIRLRHPDRVTVTILDSAGHTVATLASGATVPAHQRTRFFWDGRTDAGGRAPDGVYHPEVHLAHARQTWGLPDRITLDTKAPKVLSASREKHKSVLFAGPGRTVAIRYSFSERAHAAVYLGHRLVILGRKSSPQGKVKWAGRVRGKPLPAGTYVLSVGAQDIAGNQTPAAKRKDVPVELRYVQLSPGRITVRAGRPFGVHVRTAAPHYTWLLGKRHGTGRGKLLRLRAPTTPGTYRLFVSVDGQSTTAVVQVRAK